eukprot:NODE_756_length_4532_cov_0.574103.p3 type:complete len:140 gc:universal NODE_756_length_4532_cov_0.574103:3779-3360(-)
MPTKIFLDTRASCALPAYSLKSMFFNLAGSVLASTFSSGILILASDIAFVCKAGLILSANRFLARELSNFSNTFSASLGDSMLLTHSLKSFSIFDCSFSRSAPLYLLSITCETVVISSSSATLFPSRISDRVSCGILSM